MKKPKKPSIKSEKPKASAATSARDPYRPTAVLTFVLRHNLARNRRKGKKLLQPMERSRLTKRGINTSTLGAVDGRRFASSKARIAPRYGSAK